MPAFLSLSSYVKFEIDCENRRLKNKIFSTNKMDFNLVHNSIQLSVLSFAMLLCCFSYSIHFFSHQNIFRICCGEHNRWIEYRVNIRRGPHKLGGTGIDIREKKLNIRISIYDIWSILMIFSATHCLRS